MDNELPIRILHIDDNETNRYVVTRMLEKAGYQVTHATTGKSGLQQIQESSPDLVILDVKLPDLSGFEVCRQIKANPATAFLPVLHLSASLVQSRDKAQGLDSGADGYLAQPVEPVELLATVRSLLRIRQAEEAALALAGEWQTTFDSISDGVGLLDEDGVFLRCNRALAELLTQSIHDIIGYNHTQVITKTLGVPETSPFEKIQNTQQRESQEIQVGTRWFLITVDPIFRAGNYFSGAVYIIAEITKRRRAEEAVHFLAEASQVLAGSLDYEVTLNNVANLVVPNLAEWCVVDLIARDGKLRRVAVAHRDPQKVQFAEELAKRYPPDLNSSMGVANVIRTRQAECYPYISDDLLVKAAQDEEHLRILREAGMSSCMIVPLATADKVLGTVSFVSVEPTQHYDAEDLALAEELARRAALAVDNARLYHEAQEANRLKDEFLATLSHELRSPLNAMLGWTQLLTTRKFDEATTARAMATIERNARAQAQLVEDLLDVSRIIRGKLQLKLVPIDLVNVIEAAIETVRPAAQAKSIEISTSFDPSTGFVAGDANRLQQVFWNLVSNGVKFTSRGGRIDVSLGAVDSQVEIQVKDTGRGISADFVPYVFERFRQADSSISRSYNGLGLGLAIVRHLVELHGGTVEVYSAGEGKGSTFTVRLPQIVALNKEEQPLQSKDSNLLESELSGVKILIVDDEADTRDYLQTVLEEYGARVKVASCVSQALEILSQETLDVLISDIGMPEKDGYDLIRKVRELGQKIPAAALTAYARSEDESRVMAAGFQLHIAKPVEPTTLINTVRHLLQLGLESPQPTQT